VYALAADTDGIDGVEDNAGAFVAPDTLQRAVAQGMKLDQYLDRNDAYGYFEPLGGLVVRRIRADAHQRQRLSALLGDEMYHPTLGGYSPEWSEGED
jgi:hypothetical protein